jgi:8-hydroxy-5-deazaflavin:NADPH oxidoreductase
VRIGIIGAGNMGGALGALWAAAGHAVTFSYSRDRAKLERLAQALGHGARAGTPAEAVETADVVLLATHFNRVDDAVAQAGPGLLGRVLVDCTNPMTEDDSGLAVGHTTSGGEEVARRAPGTRVVKAFNTVPSELLASPSRRFRVAGSGATGGPITPTLFYCGDDALAKRTVVPLIRDAGLEPADAGPLSAARYLEPLAMLVAYFAYEVEQTPEVAVTLLRRAVGRVGVLR